MAWLVGSLARWLAGPVKSEQRARQSAHGPRSSRSTLPLPRSAVRERVQSAECRDLCWLLTGAATDVITPHTLALTVVCGSVQPAFWAGERRKRCQPTDDCSILGTRPLMGFRTAASLIFPPMLHAPCPCPHAPCPHAPSPVPCAFPRRACHAHCPIVHEQRRFMPNPSADSPTPRPFVLANFPCRTRLGLED